MSLRPLSTQRSFFEADMLYARLFESKPEAKRFSFFAQNILPELQALRGKLESMYCADNGRPGEEPVRLLGVLLLQFMERLPDRQAAQACTFDLRWKLALGMEVDEPAFHSTCLVRFRQRLLDHGLEALGFDAALEAMRQRGYLGRKSKRQRVDSTHVIGLVSRMGRLENVRETTRLALEFLESHVELARPQDWPIWWERYVESQPDYRASGSQLKSKFEQVGRDVQDMLAWISTLPQEVSDNNAVAILRRVHEENFEVLDNEHPCVPTRAQPPGAVHNPHEPEAQWSSKSTTKDKEWVGYKAQVAETVAQSPCQAGEPTSNVITAIVTQEAIASDKVALPPVQEQWEQHSVENPDILYVDGGYTSGAELARAQQQERQLQGPMAAAPAKDNRFSAEEFEVCPEDRRATCPAGKTNTQCSRLENAKTGKVTYRFEWSSHCAQCPLKSKCFDEKQKHRTLVVGEHHSLVQERREEQTTQPFKEDMHHRNGIEATISELVRGYGLRRSRYRGQAKTRLQNFMIGSACNIARWWRRSTWESQQAGL